MQSRITNYHLLAKPAGAACNLGCKYCFFLSKEDLYGERESPLMSDATLETYIAQAIEGRLGPDLQRERQRDGRAEATRCLHQARAA